MALRKTAQSNCHMALDWILFFLTNSFHVFSPAFILCACVCVKFLKENLNWLLCQVLQACKEMLGAKEMEIKDPSFTHSCG